MIRFRLYLMLKNFGFSFRKASLLRSRKFGEDIRASLSVADVQLGKGPDKLNMDLGLEKDQARLVQLDVLCSWICAELETNRFAAIFIALPRAIRITQIVWAIQFRRQKSLARNGDYLYAGKRAAGKVFRSSRKAAGNCGLSPRMGAHGRQCRYPIAYGIWRSL